MNLIDPSGLDTDIYIWSGVGYGASAVGHASIGINGTSYSWGPKGMDIRKRSEYIDIQTNFRKGIKISLHFSSNQENKLSNFLKNYSKNNSYWFPGNVCTEPINEALEYIGLNYNQQTIPMSLYLELIRTRIGKSPSFIEKNNE